MNGHGGFICLWRSLLGHPAFRNEGEAMQFAWMILRAQWKPARLRYKGKVIHLQRGQLAVSVRDMATALDRPRMVIQRFLENLKMQDMIRTDVGTGVNVITICNYALYQDYDEPVVTDVGTGRGTQAGQARDTEQQSKQVKQDSTPAKARGNGKTYLPSDWKPPPIAELPPKAKEAAQQWPRGAYEREAEAFTLYWNGTGKMMKDWRATWATWIHRAHWRVMADARRAPGRTGDAGDKPMYQLMADERARRA